MAVGDVADTLAGPASSADVGAPRRADASVNLAAIERNCARMRRELTGGASLCAVVKADGYGHGALPCARAALAGGASWLAVADAREAAELRAGGLGEVPILVMGPLAGRRAGAGARRRRRRGDLARGPAAGGGRRRRWARPREARHRHGQARDARPRPRPREVVAAACSTPGVTLAGLMTHFATADEHDDDGFFEQQLEAFTSWAGPLKDERPELVVHAANSAAVLRRPEAHFDMVRCGIAIYGMDPFGVDPAARELEPVLELSSYVAEVKRCGPGDSAGYGRTFRAAAETAIALLPIGYGDGWRRGLSNNGEVLIAGAPPPAGGDREHGQHHRRRRSRRGGARELRGRRAVLIGSDGGERITAEEVAAPPGDDQLRGHLRAHPAGAEDLPPRRRGGGRAARRMTPPDPPAENSPVELARLALAGRQVWLVGGAPRDRLLGRTSADVDVVLAGEVEQAARSLARAVPRAALLRAVLRPPLLAGRQHRARLAGRLRAAAGGDARAGPGAARLHRQRDRRAARRGRAGRPARRHRRPSRPAPAGGLRGGLRRRPAARDASGPGGGRARPRAGRARRSRWLARPRRGWPACRPSGCSPSCAGSSPPSRPAAASNCSRTSARAPSCCPSWRRCGESSRAATTTPTCTCTRSRCSSGRSPSRTRWRASRVSGGRCGTRWRAWTHSCAPASRRSWPSRSPTSSRGGRRWRGAPCSTTPPSPSPAAPAKGARG